MSIRFHDEIVSGGGAPGEDKLAAKQDKLTGQPGQVVGFNSDGAAQTVPGWSNPNFVDNGGFDVWQNGTEIDAIGLVYTADRWRNGWQQCRYERVDNPFPDCPCRYAMKVTTLNEEGFWMVIKQSIDPDLAKALDGQLVTVSAWVMGQSASPFIFGAGNVQTGYTIALSDQPQHIFVTGVFHCSATETDNTIFAGIAGNNDGALVGDWYIITGIKLELGDVATPYVPKGMPLEYALCSQYSPITGEWVGYQHSNENLLDTWYFVDPVNQRGQTEYIVAGYTIDRWRASGNFNMTLQSDGILLQNLDESIGVEFSTILEPGSVQPGIYTLSALTDAISGRVDFSIRRTDNWTAYFHYENISDGLASIGGVINYTNVNMIVSFYLHPGTSVKIKAAKLELGSVQTLAHQDVDGNWVLNDPPPNKALELVKCQRYMIPIDGAARYRSAQILTDGILFFIPTPVCMRANPTLTNTNKLIVCTTTGDQQNGFEFSVSSIASNGVLLLASKANHKLSDAILYVNAFRGTQDTPMLDANL